MPYPILYQSRYNETVGEVKISSVFSELSAGRDESNSRSLRRFFRIYLWCMAEENEDT